MRLFVVLFLFYSCVSFAESINIKDCKGPEVDPLIFGNNTHFYSQTDGHYGFGGTKGFFEQLQSATLRFPGGEDSDNYLWDHYKPRRERLFPDRKHLYIPESYPEQENIEYADNFIMHLRKVKGSGTESNFVVNVEIAFVEWDKARESNPNANLQEFLNIYAAYAADWVREVKSKGFYVKYWEIGNEPYYNAGIRPLSAAQYAQALNTYSKKMKEVDSTIQIGAVGFKDWNKKTKIDKDNGGSAWWPQVVKDSKGKFDFAVIHEYQQSYFKNRKVGDENLMCSVHADCPQPDTDTCFCGGGQSCEGNIGKCKYLEFEETLMTGNLTSLETHQTLRRNLETELNSPGIKIFVTEWNVYNKYHRSVTWQQHAAYATETFTTMVAGGMSSTQYWSLSSKGTWGFAMSRRPSAGGPFQSAPEIEYQPPFHLYKLWQEHLLGQVAIVEKSPSMTYAFSSCNDNLNQVSTFLVNKDNSMKKVNLTGLRPGSYSVEEFKASDLPKIEAPTTVSINDLQYSIDYEKMELSLPPYATVVVSNLYEKPLQGAKLGVYRPSTQVFDQDVNGNALWDKGTDKYFGGFSIEGDLPLVGDWNGDGFTEIGSYRPSTRSFRLDLNANGKWDGPAIDRLIEGFGKQGDIPISGDWDGDGIDQIGVYRAKDRSFSLDFNDSGAWEGGPDRWFQLGKIDDLPIVGDFNGDGRDNVGTFRPKDGSFSLQMDYDYKWDGKNSGGDDVWVGQFAQPTDIPIIGDWNNDGIDDIGVYRKSERLFVLDRNGNRKLDYKSDYFKTFGRYGDLPLAGRWK